MSGLLSFFITPALVSLLVSLWASRVMDEKRARRDHVTRLFETAREDVRRAVDVALDYFAETPGQRSPLQEAKVIGADRELRAALSLLLEHPRSKGDPGSSAAAKEAFTTFLMELTGGNFQASDGEVARDHIFRIVHFGAKLRTALAKLRDAELKDRASQDPLVRWARTGIEMWHTPMS